jgi:cytochrome c
MRTRITNSVRICAIAMGACLASAGGAWAAFSYPGCADLAQTDFKAVKLVARADGIAEPLKMALDGDAAGNIDVYWVERLGDVKRYSTASKSVTKLATVNVDSKFESGLSGIALDPGFKTNNWIYLYYSFGNAAKYSYRVSRFTLDRTSNSLDLPGEKIVLEFSAGYNKMHTGGAMRFDAAGDLWITTGENGAGLAGAGNTNDLRGKILRIHPTADGGYTTPAGNLFPAGTPKTRPEIYVMGARNPYTLALDPVRKAIAWGDVGPDQGKDSEEFDFTTVPGNFGWPQFAGNNIVNEGNADPKAPAVVNSGASPLPPAIGAIYNYHQSASMTGPVYYYDSRIKSAAKFPPHLNGVWFVSDFSQNWIEGVSLDASGKAITKKERIFTDLWGKTIRLAIDMDFGPDGAMYVLGYSSGAWFGADAGTSIFRVEYTGACAGPVGLRPAAAAAGASVFTFGHRNISVTGEGPHTVEIRGPSGRIAGILRGQGPATHSLRGLAGKGVCFVTVRTREGVFRKTLLLEND